MLDLQVVVVACPGGVTIPTDTGHDYAKPDTSTWINQVNVPQGVVITGAVNSVSPAPNEGEGQEGLALTFMHGSTPFSFSIADPKHSQTELLGNRAALSCRFDVVVEDKEPPLLRCPAPSTRLIFTPKRQTVAYLTYVGSYRDPLPSHRTPSILTECVRQYGKFLC